MSSTYRLITFVLCFLLACLPAQAAISKVTSNSASGTSATYGAHSTGDAEVVCAYNSASATVPTLPLGYTLIASSGASLNALLVAYRYTSSSETATSVFANATKVGVTIYHGEEVNSNGPIGGVSLVGAGSGTSISFPSVTMTRGDSTSWVIGCDGAISATNANAAPTGMTLETGIGGSAPSFGMSDTLGGVPSWTAAPITVSPTGTWRSYTFELMAVPPRTADNLLVSAYHSGHTNKQCTSPCVFTIKLANTLLSSNLIHLWVDACGGTVLGSCVSNPTINSITDDAGNVWTLDATEVNTTDFVTSSGYHTCGATPASNVFINMAAGNIVDLHYSYTERKGIALTSCTDGTAVGALVSGPGGVAATNMTPGSITTVSDGDVIDSHCIYVSNGLGTGDSGQLGANISVPLGLATFRDLSLYSSDQSFIQTTHGAVSPYFNMFSNNAQDFNCLGVAFKTAAAGTSPAPGIRIAKIMYVTTTALAAQPVLWDGTGNAIVAGSSNISQDITAMSDAAGDSYRFVHAATPNTAPSFAYATNVTPASQKLTVTSGTLTTQWFMIFDISGVLGGSPSCSITNVALTTNVVTITCPNTFATGNHVSTGTLGTATYLSNQELTVASASGSQFTANFTHANDTSHADTGTVSTSAFDTSVLASGTQGAAATITNIALTSNVVTITAANTFSAGDHVSTGAITTATYLSNQELVVASAVAGSFTAPFTHANDTSHADSGTVTPDILNAPSLTPAVANELILDINGFGTGPASAVIPGTLDCVFYPGEDDTDKTCNGDGFAHYYSPNTSTVSFQWKRANPIASSWNATALALQQASTTGTGGASMLGTSSAKGTAVVK